MFTFVCLLIFWITWSDLKNLKHRDDPGWNPIPLPLICVCSGPQFIRGRSFWPRACNTICPPLFALFTLNTQLSFQWPCGLFYYSRWFLLLILWVVLLEKRSRGFIGSEAVCFQEDTRNSAIPNIVRLALASSDEYRCSPMSCFVITADPEGALQRAC